MCVTRHVYIPFFTHVQMLYDFHDKRVVTQVVDLMHRVADQVGYFIEEAKKYNFNLFRNESKGCK